MHPWGVERAYCYTRDTHNMLKIRIARTIGRRSDIGNLYIRIRFRIVPCDISPIRNERMMHAVVRYCHQYWNSGEGGGMNCNPLCHSLLYLRDVQTG